MKSIFQHLGDPSIIDLHEFKFRNTHCCYIFRKNPDTGLGEAHRGKGPNSFESVKQAYSSTTPLFTFELDGAIEHFFRDRHSRPVDLKKLWK